MSKKELNLKKEELLIRLQTLDLSATDLDKCLSECNSIITKFTNKCQKAKDPNFSKNELKEKLKDWINSLTQKTDVCTPFQYEDLNELYRSDGKIFIIILEEVCKLFVDRHFWKTLYESNDDKLKSIEEFINVLSISVSNFSDNVVNMSDSVFDVAVQLYKKENGDNSFNNISSNYKQSEFISYDIDNDMSDNKDKINYYISDGLYDISSSKENNIANNQTNIATTYKTFENNNEILLPCYNEAGLSLKDATKNISETKQVEGNYVKENLNVPNEKLEINKQWADELLELLEDCKERNNLIIELYEGDKLQNIMVLCKHFCGLIEKSKADTFCISYLEDDISSIEEERCSFVDSDFVLYGEIDVTKDSKTRIRRKTNNKERLHMKQNINKDEISGITNGLINQSNCNDKEQLIGNTGDMIARKISMNENFYNKIIKNNNSTDSEDFDYSILSRMKIAVESRKCINEKKHKVLQSKKLPSEKVKNAEKTNIKGYKEFINNIKGDNQNKKIKNYQKPNRCCM